MVTRVSLQGPSFAPGNGSIRLYYHPVPMQLTRRHTLGWHRNYPNSPPSQVKFWERSPPAINSTQTVRFSCKGVGRLF